jgi:hypothetical protein
MLHFIDATLDKVDAVFEKLTISLVKTVKKSICRYFLLGELEK